ncbi:uncharacterized protein LOC119365188 [Triticum dicoccoides]|uniref:uncharacterized protein LOC119365188 n=1 Tax=Triticum dicoccoides TaxID=85692 RepID=UPI00188FE2CD|nr:uncharacterized protein LOC119365188 [Triticum dicoccoides]
MKGRILQFQNGIKQRLERRWQLQWDGWRRQQAVPNLCLRQNRSSAIYSTAPPCVLAVELARRRRIIFSSLKGFLCIVMDFIVMLFFSCMARPPPVQNSEGSEARKCSCLKTQMAPLSCLPSLKWVCRDLGRCRGAWCCRFGWCSGTTLLPRAPPPAHFHVVCPLMWATPLKGFPPVGVA